MFEVNEYFDAKVKSIAFDTPTNTATMGVMAPGEYEFATSQHETMTVVSGIMSVLLPDASDWATYTAGKVFKIAADQTFQVKVSVNTAYLCLYE